MLQLSLPDVVAAPFVQQAQARGMSAQAVVSGPHPVRLGSLKGRGAIIGDFDEPLPEDLRRAFGS